MLPAFEVALSLLSGVPFVLFNVFITLITLVGYVLALFGILAHTRTYVTTVSSDKTYDQAWKEVTANKAPSPLIPLGIVFGFGLWVVLIFMTCDKYGGKVAFLWIHLQVLFVCVVVVSLVVLGAAGLVLSIKALGRWSSSTEGKKEREQTDIQMEEGVKLMEKVGEVDGEEDSGETSSSVQEGTSGK